MLSVYTFAFRSHRNLDVNIPYINRHRKAHLWVNVEYTWFSWTVWHWNEGVKTVIMTRCTFVTSTDRDNRIFILKEELSFLCFTRSSLISGEVHFNRDLLSISNHVGIDRSLSSCTCNTPQLCVLLDVLAVPLPLFPAVRSFTSQWKRLADQCSRMMQPIGSQRRVSFVANWSVLIACSPIASSHAYGLCFRPTA